MSVRLRLDEPALAVNLLDFLERRGCAGRRAGDDVIEVELPDELDPDEGRLELDLYLRVWQSLHGWTRVDVVD
jgi:hypothetical protein